MKREEAIKLLICEKACVEDVDGNIGGERVRQAYDMAIEALQTDIVRCKDCRHKVTTKEGEYNPEDIVCDYWMSDGLEETDYCSYGERKGGEDE